MRKFVLPLVVVLGTSVFWGLSHAFPQLLHEESIKSAAGLYAFVAALLGIFLRQFLSTQATDILKPREAERYMGARARIRAKIWVVVACSALASLCLWTLANLADKITWINGARLLVGLCISIGVYLLLAIARWISDWAQFSDSLRLKEQTRKYSDAVLKRLADASKQGLPSR